MDEIPAQWMRLIADVKRTTGFTLEFVHWPDFGKSVDVEWAAHVPDGHPYGAGLTSFQRHDDLSPEDELAMIIDYLQEQLLHEAIWGGWPTCPVHNTPHCKRQVKLK